MRTVLILSAALAASACGSGGGSSPPTAPPPSGVAATVVTITASGTSPQNPNVPLGGRIRWVNNDNRVHEMSSDPHPEHNQCPALNTAAIAPGQSRETQNLVTARTCGYHDHLNPETTSLQGTVTIQ